MARIPALVRMGPAPPARQSAPPATQAGIEILDSHREFLAPMIILLHPRSTKPKNRRFPLAVLSLAAVLEGKEEFAIVDGNADSDPGKTLDRIVNESGCIMLAVSVMPGPQMKAAIPICREFRAKHPGVPIVWGGYFPSLYTDTALNACYVDVVVRGQGERTFL